MPRTIPSYILFWWSWKHVMYHVQMWYIVFILFICLCHVIVLSNNLVCIMLSGNRWSHSRYCYHASCGCHIESIRCTYIVVLTFRECHVHLMNDMSCILSCTVVLIFLLKHLRYSIIPLLSSGTWHLDNYIWRKVENRQWINKKFPKGTALDNQNDVSFSLTMTPFYI